MAFCQANNIAVTYTPDARRDPVVEHVGLLICLGQRKKPTKACVKASGITCGTLFTGEAPRHPWLWPHRRGGEVARAFRMEVIAHDIDEDPAWAEQHGVRYVELDELMAESQAVTIHLPLTTLTWDIVGLRELRLMPKGAYLLNTCRGEVLDRDALYECLKKDGHLGSAALDVYARSIKGRWPNCPTLSPLLSPRLVLS